MYESVEGAVSLLASHSIPCQHQATTYHVAILPNAHRNSSEEIAG
jgi:hypothetical protein